MTFNHAKTLMVLLVCLTFVGQAMASTIMSYHMMSMAGMNGQTQSQYKVMSDHTNHNMTSDADVNSAESTEDCCTKASNCFTGSCSIVAAFMKDAGNAPILDMSSKIPSYSCMALSQQPTSLYRPPILS